MTKKVEWLSLKWGSLKGWDLDADGPAFAAVKKLELCESAMFQVRTPEMQQIICEIIDALNAETVYLDWDDVNVSKEEAKAYILNYGN